MLSICVVTQQLGKIISGPGLHACNLVRSLVADGHQVTVIAPEDQRPVGELAYRFVALPRTPIRSHARWLPLSWHISRMLGNLEREQNFDLIHFTEGRDAFLANPRTPCVGNINDTYTARLESFSYYRKHYNDWMARAFYYRLTHLAERHAFTHFQALLANSQYTANVVADQYPATRRLLRVIYKSVDAAAYAPALQLRAHQSLHAPRVLMVGGNMQRKGLPDLIRSAPTVLEQFPDCEFWSVGQDPAVPNLKMLARQLGVADHFHFLGLQTQEKLVEIYSAVDIFAMPSLSEAFGVVFLEAMAAGVPVIGSCVGGIPEIIHDRQNGLLVPPSDPVALAEALITLLKDANLRESFRSAGLITAGQFTIEKMMEETYRVYSEVLSINHRP